MNPIAIATKGKGLLNMIKRSTVISRRYGVTERKMDRILTRFDHILKKFDSKATFPITGAALARSKSFTDKYRGAQIEFAAHGYYHIDHAQLSLHDQVDQLTAVNRLFVDRGLTPAGFRCPYLRWNPETVEAVQKAGFAYDSSQALVWPIDDSFVTDAYRRVLDFYGAVSAETYPALPRWRGGLVRIPYCLPDDEALIDRLAFASPEAMHQIWPDLLEKTHALGELFTLGLHPERLVLCEPGLVKTLEKARTLSPRIWQARLDEVVTWWQSRTRLKAKIDERADGVITVRVPQLDGVTVLVRGVDVQAETRPWDNLYRQVIPLSFVLRAKKRPFIAVSPGSDPYLSDFLRQQGYLVETAPSSKNHVFFLDRPRFADEDERPLLNQIESGSFPLVRLGRWPNGARSALCITGDIDALTIWDYGLRFLGN